MKTVLALIPVSASKGNGPEVIVLIAISSFGSMAI